VKGQTQADKEYYPNDIQAFVKGLHPLHLFAGQHADNKSGIDSQERHKCA
jgi:hypothetical protein